MLPAPVDMKSIGGLVKSCTGVAVKSAIKDMLKPYDNDDKYYNVGDWDMVQYLQRWYWTRHNDILKQVEEKDKKIMDMEHKLKKVKQIVK